ncbi:MAG: redoxin domain-containing protein [Planctomycetota bacterium]
MTIRLLFTVVGVLITGLTSARGDEAHPPTEAKPALPRTAKIRYDRDAHRVGDRMDEVHFQLMSSAEEKTAALSELTRANPLVIVAREAECPLCRRYGPTLKELETQFAGRANFLFLNVSAVDDVAAAKGDLRRFEFEGDLALDPKRRAAATLGITSTTEVLVIDRARTLRYRGAVDDQYGVGVAQKAPNRRFLVDALNAVLMDRSVPVAATTAPGCRIEIGKPFASTGPTTYHEHISRIVERRCQSCHRDDGVGPFALETYRQVSGRKEMIADVIEDGLMPPWSASPEHGEWANDWSLTEGEKASVLAWIEAGAPEGDAVAAPVARTWTPEWTIGAPDLVVEIPQPQRVPASGVVDYIYAYVQVPTDEDRWIESMEIRPTAPNVVHHVLVFLEEPRRSGESRRDFRRRFRGGLHGYFAGMVPGQGWTIYPGDRGKKLPAGAWLKFQIHYTPNGIATTDRTKLGFRFRKSAPEHEVKTVSAATTRFQIPPGDANHRVEARYRFRNDATIESCAPHMHLSGKAFRYELVVPDGNRVVLLDIPRYDFNWQLRYRLREPRRVEAGSILRAIAWFDNSEGNPANPDPTDTVTFGEQTFDEMMIGYFEIY